MQYIRESTLLNSTTFLVTITAYELFAETSGF